MPAGTAVGQYQLTVTATFGASTQTYTFPLYVVTLSGTLNGSALTIAQGGNGTLTATLNATTGFSDVVSLRLLGVIAAQLQLQSFGSTGDGRYGSNCHHHGKRRNNGFPRIKAGEFCGSDLGRHGSLDSADALLWFPAQDTAKRPAHVSARPLRLCICRSMRKWGRRWWWRRWRRRWRIELVFVNFDGHPGRHIDCEHAGHSNSQGDSLIGE